jgi:hypothetical protein
LKSSGNCEASALEFSDAVSKLGRSGIGCGIDAFSGCVAASFRVPEHALAAGDAALAAHR